MPKSVIEFQVLVLILQKLTLDSGIDVAPGINVARGTFGKDIKRSPESRHPPYHQIGNI